MTLSVGSIVKLKNGEIKKIKSFDVNIANGFNTVNYEDGTRSYLGELEEIFDESNL